MLLLLNHHYSIYCRKKEENSLLHTRLTNFSYFIHKFLLFYRNFITSSLNVKKRLSTHQKKKTFFLREETTNRLCILHNISWMNVRSPRKIPFSKSKSLLFRKWFSCLFFSKNDIGVIKETFWHDQFIHLKGVAHIIFSHSFQIPYHIQHTRTKKKTEKMRKVWKEKFSCSWDRPTTTIKMLHAFISYRHKKKSLKWWRVRERERVRKRERKMEINPKFPSFLINSAISIVCAFRLLCTPELISRKKYRLFFFSFLLSSSIHLWVFLSSQILFDCLENWKLKKKFFFMLYMWL